MVSAVLAALGMAGGLGAVVRALVGLAALAVVVGLPPVYAFTGVLREWSHGTAVWWLPLPAPAWLRLGVKGLRGLTLGWGLGLLGGLTYLLPTVLSGPDPDLVYAVRLFLFLALAAVPLAALGGSLALWTLRLRRLPWVARTLAATATVAALGTTLAGLIASVEHNAVQVCAASISARACACPWGL